MTCLGGIRSLYSHHQAAQHFQIGNQQFGLCVQLMPHRIELRLQNLMKAFRDTILDGDFLHVDESIDSLGFLHQKIHDVQQMRLNGDHFLRHRHM